ncbi:Fic/DOC family N-terminal domain-containing protein [Bifidobacterium bifidum]
MRREAQSTSALEGTFEPLETVLAQDYEVGEDKSGLSESMREVLNYLDAAECGIGQIQSGHPISLHSRARIAEASCEGHEVRQSAGLGYTIHPSVHRLTHAAHRGCAFRAHISRSRPGYSRPVACEPGGGHVKSRDWPYWIWRCSTISSRRCIRSRTATGELGGCWCCCR